MPETITTETTANTGEGPDKKTAAETDKGTQPDKSPENAKTFAQEEVNRIVAREVAKATKKANEDAAAAQADAKKSLEEKLQSENESLKSQIRERDARDEFLRAASDKKIQARSPHALFEIGKSRLEYDKQGAIVNLKDVISDLKDEFPELFGADRTTVNGSERDAGKDKSHLFGASRLAHAYAENAKNGRR